MTNELAGSLKAEAFAVGDHLGLVRMALRGGYKLGAKCRLGFGWAGSRGAVGQSLKQRTPGWRAGRPGLTPLAAARAQPHARVGLAACGKPGRTRESETPARPGGKRLAHARAGASDSPGWGKEGGVSKGELDPLAGAAMAAHSPPSPLLLPSARQLGPWSPRVGWGAVVHAVRSEPSVLAGAEREGVVDKSDISWRGEEGSGGRRGPVGAPPARAPLLSAPSGARRLEGISVEEAMVTRTQLLEEELSSVKEELALCQVSRGHRPFPLHGGAGAVGRRAPLSLPSPAWCAGLGPSQFRPASTPTPAGVRCC